MTQINLKSSRRIQQTPSAIIDELLEEHPNVRFNLCPGAPSATPNLQAIATCQAHLSEMLCVTNMSRYDEVIGTTALRRQWLSYLFGREVSSFDSVIPGHEFMITSGANQAFVNVILTICDMNDEVIILVPYYFSHINALIMHGVKPILINVSRKDFLPRLCDIKAAVTSHTRAIVVTNPGNPSGVTIPRDILDELSKLCEKEHIYLCIDEAYREYDFSIKDVVNVAYSPELHEYMIKIYTMSKAFGMAGWRIGGVIYPKDLGENMRKVQDTIPTHAALFSQTLAVEVLKYKPTHMDNALQVGKIFIQVLRPVYRGSPLHSLFVEPTGAFYLFLPYRNVELDTKRTAVKNDDIAVKMLAKEFSVLTAPGHAFGMAGYVRVCYGSVGDDIALEAARAVAAGMRILIDRFGGSHTAL